MTNRCHGQKRWSVLQFVQLTKSRSTWHPRLVHSLNAQFLYCHPYLHGSPRRTMWQFVYLQLERVKSPMDVSTCIKYRLAHHCRCNATEYMGADECYYCRTWASVCLTKRPLCKMSHLYQDRAAGGLHCVHNCFVPRKNPQHYDWQSWYIVVGLQTSNFNKHSRNPQNVTDTALPDSIKESLSPCGANTSVTLQ